MEFSFEHVQLKNVLNWRWENNPGMRNPENFISATAGMMPRRRRIGIMPRKMKYWWCILDMLMSECSAIILLSAPVSLSLPSLFSCSASRNWLNTRVDASCQTFRFTDQLNHSCSRCVSLWLPAVVCTNIIASVNGAGAFLGLPFPWGSCDLSFIAI